MKVKFKIYCGETIKQWELLNGMHPVQQFNFAKQQIELIKHIRDVKSDSEKVITINSNQPDFVSTIYYGADKFNIPCEIYLNGELSTLDDVFKDWNKFYDLLNEYIEE